MCGAVVCTDAGDWNGRCVDGGREGLHPTSRGPCVCIYPLFSSREDRSVANLRFVVMDFAWFQLGCFIHFGLQACKLHPHRIHNGRTFFSCCPLTASCHAAVSCRCFAWRCPSSRSHQRLPSPTACLRLLSSSSLRVFLLCHPPMSATRRAARRTLALFPTSSFQAPPNTRRLQLTRTCYSSFLSCRRYLASTSTTLAFSTTSTPTVSPPSPSTDTPAGAADDRWSHILDPHNPPKLTLAHYALLNKIPAKTTAASSAPPPSTPNPGLDRAINSLQRMIATLGQSDPAVRHDLTVMQQQLIQPSGPSDAATADSAPSFFVPTQKLKCRFCAVKRFRHANPTYEIDYTNLALLHQFINLRGMIYARKLTGTCGRHQRQLTQAIKRARVMGLLAFTSNWRLPEGWGDVEAAGGGGLMGGSGDVSGEVGEMVPESEELSFLDEFEETEEDESARETNSATRDRR